MKKFLNALPVVITGILIVLIFTFSIYSSFNPGEGKNGKGLFASPNKSGLTSFEYSFSDYTTSDSYSVKVSDGTFSYEDVDLAYLGTMTTPADSALIEKLNELYLKYKTYRWDGFDKVDKSSKNNTGFSLSMGFANGKGMSCKGYFIFPGRFEKYSEELSGVLTPYMEKARKSTSERKKAEGVTGRLIMVSASFKQQGTSGANNYKVVIYDPSVTSTGNFQLQADCLTDEFAASGVYMTSKTFTRPETQLDDIQAIVEKYDLESWFDFTGESQDPANSESFVLRLAFDSGDEIRASGTLHPENYDEFRSELLTLVFRVIEENGGWSTNS